MIKKITRFDLMDIEPDPVKIENLTEEDVGRKITYTGGYGINEVGFVTSWNEIYIFVDYGYSDGRGIATSSRDLKWGWG